ncbi:MAG: sigma-54 dependent transcriptional regulator [Candidatus Anammoxibacter sp.]
MKPKILLIDDEEILLTTFKIFLLDEGYEVSTANDYNEALTSIAQTEFDLILTDILLDCDNTGIDILREVKTRNLTSPVVLITGNPDIETASEAVRQGAYDYICKPVGKDTLIHIAGMALQHKSLIDENVKYQANLEAIFRSVNDAIITVDSELFVLEINEAARKLCGFSRDVKGKPANSLLKACSERCYDALIETIKKKKPMEIYRIEWNSHDRTRLIVNLATYPLLDSQKRTYGCVIVVKDETRLTELECMLQKRQKFHNIIGKSDKMQRVYSFIDNLADTQTTVLITGESGTGKELVAAALHKHKKMSNKPLVKVNCAALSDDLLESELFGHVKGAFTGAVNDRIGRFQKADGGTIFLDEIGDISNKMQLRLLRVLQEMEFERVGDSTPIKVDVRVIAATNQDLKKKIRLGRFREDLYHRLAVVELNLPLLRDIREDIPLLIDHFIKKFNEKFNKNILGISDDVQRIFMDYTWPGNVRELEHKLEHAFIFCYNPIITVGDLPVSFEGINRTKGYPLGEKRADDPKDVILALKNAGWNKAKAARQLGVTRRTLYLKIKKFNIQED